jgi:hypothetical protein
MFSFFKDMAGKVNVDASRWTLDQEESEISKDIHVSKGGKEIQRIQVRYVVDNAFIDDKMEEGLKNLLKNTHHLGIVYAPSIGAGDGYLAFRITSMKSKNVLFASVHTSDQENHSVLVFQGEQDVLKVSELFSTGEDVFFELSDMSNKLVIKFIVPNESGFDAARAELLRGSS